MRFLPYQVRWLNDDSRYKIALKARQVGFTTVLCAEALLLADKERCKVLILSSTERQSIEVLERVYGFLNIAKRHFGIKLPRETRSEVELPNGSRIISLPASPNSVRGYTGHVFLDEFAFHQDAGAIWRAMAPVAMRSEYRIRVVSTPAGKLGKFWELWDGAGKAGWSAHRVTIHDAIAQGLDIDLDDLRASCGNREDFAQEFECEFLDGAYSFFPLELIDRAVVREDPILFGLEGEPLSGDFHVGVDVGRKHDLTVIAVTERVGDVFHLRALKEMSDEPFHAQRDMVRWVVRRFRPRRVCIDATGLGMQLAEELGREMGSLVEPVTFTASVKEDLAGFARKLFDDRRVRIPDHPALIRDIHGIRKTVTSAGNFRFDAERNQDGHSDRFWALALAFHAGGDTVAGPVPAVMTRSRRETARIFKTY